MCIRHASFGDFRDNVFTEIVTGVFIEVIFRQQFIQIIGVENVDPHTGKRFGRVAWHGWRIGGFFNELDNFIGVVHVHHAKRAGLFNRHWHTGHGATRAFLDVVDQHA